MCAISNLTWPFGEVRYTGLLLLPGDILTIYQISRNAAKSQIEIQSREKERVRDEICWVNGVHTVIHLMIKLINIFLY